MKSQVILIALISVLVTSCSPTFYIPNTQNIPLIESKGQINLSLAGNGNQAEFQGAFGLTHNLALQFNGGLMIPKDLENGDGGSGKFIEGGIGYYKPIAKNFLFEGYGLIGYGGLENHMPSTILSHPGTTGKISASLLRLGMQPAMSFKTKYLSVTGSFRLASLNYSNMEGNLIFENADQVNVLLANKSTLVFEPSLTLRVGPEKVKLQLQISKSWNLTNKDFRQDDKLLSIGLNFNFK